MSSLTNIDGRDEGLVSTYALRSLPPFPDLWSRLLERIGAPEQGAGPPATPSWSEPPWEDVGSGIACKILSTDRNGDRVAMLVRLAPGASYPPHTHAAVEELHLLTGELWIDEKKLHPGDYNRGEPGASDHRVWSETGCTCVLITAPSDVLR
jgi:anti-sigma factor ChrR (cupin superfamily)